MSKRMRSQLCAPLERGAGPALAGGEATLRDGRRIRIRRLASGDRAHMASFFESLSPESLYWRFFSSQRHMKPEMLDRLLEQSFFRAAFVAVPSGAPEAIVGFSGWVHVATEGSTEVSVVVADDWQNAGLGRLLVLAAVRHAASRGFRRFHGEILSSNVRMLRVVRRIAGRFRSRVESGVSRIEIEVSGAPGSMAAA